MTRPSILSTHVLFDAPRRRLAEHFDVDYWDGAERPPRAEVLRRIAGKDALITLITECIDDEVLAAAPALRIVANVGVGYDNIDVAACTTTQRRRQQYPGCSTKLQRTWPGRSFWPSPAGWSKPTP